MINVNIFFKRIYKCFKEVWNFLIVLFLLKIIQTLNGNNKIFVILTRQWYQVEVQHVYDTGCINWLNKTISNPNKVNSIKSNKKKCKKYPQLQISRPLRNSQQQVNLIPTWNTAFNHHGIEVNKFLKQSWSPKFFSLEEFLARLNVDEYAFGFHSI